jgi:hypothetical protein
VYLATGTAVIVEPDKGSSATAKDLVDSLVDSEELALPPYAAEVFSIWMASSFLGIGFIGFVKKNLYLTLFTCYMQRSN